MPPKPLHHKVNKLPTGLPNLTQRSENALLFNSYINPDPGDDTLPVLKLAYPTEWIKVQRRQHSVVIYYNNKITLTRYKDSNSIQLRTQAPSELPPDVWHDVTCEVPMHFSVTSEVR